MDISLNLEVLVKDGRLVLTDRDGKVVSFSPDQSVQRKVSMVTFGELCDVPKLRVAEAFGFKTRNSYYDARNVVLHGASADLLPKRRGPQRPPKRTRDIEILIIGMRCETDLNMYEIAEQLGRMGLDVSARLVGQVLSDYGLSKKNG